jgi:hypothetical protein
MVDKKMKYNIGIEWLVKNQIDATK